MFTTAKQLTCSNKHLVDFRCAAKTKAFLHALEDATNEWFECCDRCSTFGDFAGCNRLTSQAEAEAHRSVADALKCSKIIKTFKWKMLIKLRGARTP